MDLNSTIIKYKLNHLRQDLENLKNADSIQKMVQEWIGGEKNDVKRLERKISGIEAKQAELVQQKNFAKEEYSQLYGKKRDLRLALKQAKERDISPNIKANLENVSPGIDDAFYNVDKVVDMVRDLLNHTDRFQHIALDVLGNFELMTSSPMINSEISQDRDFHVGNIERIHREAFPHKYKREKPRL